jgi:hypothetical protein
MGRRLLSVRRKHMQNVASVLALLEAAGIDAFASGAASAAPQIRTEHGTLSFEDDGTIRASVVRRPELRVVRP